MQLETVLEGVMTQVDAMGSKLTMVERKGWLAPLPGTVSGPSPGSSWLPTADLYHLFHSADGGKTFLKGQHFILLGQHVASSQSVSGGQRVERRTEVGFSGLRVALASRRGSGVGETDPGKRKVGHTPPPSDLSFFSSNRGNKAFGSTCRQPQL